MGVMDEVAKLAETIETPENRQEITEAHFEELLKADYAGKTEVELKTGLNFIRLHAGVYENGRPTNGIINVNQPWDVRVSFGLVGPLREIICGKWCATVDFESIGPGHEFRVSHPEFDFNCKHRYWSLCFPGPKLDPTRCTTPYKMVATVAARSHCGRPVGILGYVELPIVQFYAAD
jgi:hypothetical protein